MILRSSWFSSQVLLPKLALPQLCHLRRKVLVAITDVNEPVQFDQTQTFLVNENNQNVGKLSDLVTDPEGEHDHLWYRSRLYRWRTLYNRCSNRADFVQEYGT